MQQLFRPDVFRAFDRLWEQMDDALRGAGAPTNLRSNGRGFPALNAGTTDEAVELVAFAPGLDPATLEVTVDRGLLTISGERKSALAELPEGTTVYARERLSGSFRRAVELPRDADPDRVQARYVDGCLRITVGRKESAKPRAITVQ
nr:Hsp20/alpha crystallin family protein [Bordetella genomosp. 13]